MQSKYFTTEWQLRMLSSSSSWFFDTFTIALPSPREQSAFNVFVILCQDPRTRIVVPCFFGVFVYSNPSFNYEVYARLLRVLLLKSPTLLDPTFISVDYDDELRRAVAEIFPQAMIACTFVHRINFIWKLCNQSVGLYRGVKPHEVTFFVNFFLVISLLPPHLFIKHWHALKDKLHPEHPEAFREVIHRIEADFIMPLGKYHREISIEPFLVEKAYETANFAIEGYRQRMHHLIKGFIVTSPEYLAEKILIKEEHLFAAKVAAAVQGFDPVLNDSFMSFGSLQVLSTMNEINSLKMQLDPFSLAELLVRNSELRQMRQFA